MLIQTIDLDVATEVQQLRHGADRKEPEVLIREIGRIFGFPKIAQVISSEMSSSEIAKCLKEGLGDKRFQEVLKECK